MGSESDNGWWESLFRRSDGSQAEARDEQLGSNEDRQVSGQTGSPLSYSIYDEVTGESIVVALVCTCETQVILMEKNSFFCPHCDKECKIDAKSCLTCMDYNFNFEDRLKAEEDYDADL
jgi:hypothetical protein